MILVVTGGRDYKPSFDDLAKLSDVIDQMRVTEFRHGGCRGVDRTAAAHVKRNHPTVRVEEYGASWEEHGKSAGPIRNAAMLVGAGVLVAFPGGRGTRDTVHKALAARIYVHRIGEWPAKVCRGAVLTGRDLNRVRVHDGKCCHLPERSMTRSTEPDAYDCERRKPSTGGVNPESGSTTNHAAKEAPPRV